MPEGISNRAVMKSRAYQRLGVHPYEVLESPRITPRIRSLEGGWLEALAALRASSLEDARRFLYFYDDITLPAYCRQYLPVEAFALAAGIPTERLWETIIISISRQRKDHALYIAATAVDKVVQAAVESALIVGKEGIADRQLLFRQGMLLPVPASKSPSVSVSVQANSNSAAQSQSSSQSLAGAPSAADTVRRLSDRFNDADRGGRIIESKPIAELPAAPTDEEFLPPAMPSSDQMPDPEPLPISAMRDSSEELNMQEYLSDEEL